MFSRQLLLNAGQKYCRMLFQPSLSYQLPLRPLFSVFLSGRLKQVFCMCIRLKIAFLQFPMIGLKEQMPNCKVLYLIDLYSCYLNRNQNRLKIGKSLF